MTYRITKVLAASQLKSGVVFQKSSTHSVFIEDLEKEANKKWDILYGMTQMCSDRMKSRI